MEEEKESMGQDEEDARGDHISGDRPEEGASSGQAKESLGLFSSLKKEPVEVESKENEEELQLLSQGARRRFGHNREPPQDSDDRENDDRDAKYFERIKLKYQIDPKYKRNRMNAWQTFFAIIKGYTTMNIFMLPIGFRDGGWLFSPIALIISCFFETVCALKMCEIAHTIKIYNYLGILEYCFGSGVQKLISLIIGILCFQFTLTPLSFFTKTLQSLFRIWFGIEVSIWYFGLVTFIIFTLLAWVRTIERFKIGFVFAVLVIFGMLITISVIELQTLSEREWEAGPDWQAFNSKMFFTMIGLAFYMFEGITAVLPIMEASDAKESFPCLLIGALIFLCVLNIGFSELCYYTFGNDLKEPVIIQQMPEENLAIIIFKALYCITIIFSFPLNIYVINGVVEGFIFSSMPYSTLRKWLKNLSRMLIVILAVFIAISFYYDLHKILGLSGVIFGSIVVLIMPSLSHNRLVAQQGLQRTGNYFIIVYAVFMMVVIGFCIIYFWNVKD